MSTYEWITTFLVPVTGIVTWLFSSRKRRNDSLNELQTTINMLVDENKRIYEELAETRRELAEAKAEIANLRVENSELKTMIEKLQK